MIMKHQFIYQQTLKQTLHMTTGLKNHLDILSKDRQSLSDILQKISQNNPFLEYTPSQDIQQFLDSRITSLPNLKDELYLQLHTLQNPYNGKITSYIIESLDSHGFFNYDLDTVLQDLKCSKQTFLNNLFLIQSFEPIGVAAKNSIDSIYIQLQAKGYLLAAQILKEYPKEIEVQDFSSISKQINIPYEKVIEEISHMQECTPFPCSKYENDHTHHFVLPEFSIHIEENQIQIVPKEMGTLTLQNEDVEVTKELRKYLNEAHFYIDSINRRNKTILLLANILISYQKNYFLFHDDLKECTLKQISIESGYSISTVSRTLCDKYYEFNNQIYPIKNLFISKTHAGTSKDSIQNAIQLLIKTEDKNCPLQDEQIKEELANMELYVSRRTISKYRNELHIPNSKQRKKEAN